MNQADIEKRLAKLESLLSPPEHDSSQQRRPRRKKGTVAIFATNGWLKLRWSHGRKRYVLACNLTDSTINRKVAQLKAQSIEADIRNEQFDSTLERYRPKNEPVEINICDIFKRYSQFKARNLEKRSLEKYQGLQGHLEHFFGAKPIEQLDVTQALNFRDWLLKRLKPITVRERIAMLRSCWRWAERQQITDLNPWLDVSTKVPPRQKARPFTADESYKIIASFREHFPHYADFTEFLLSIGCRPGEAAGLRWRHLSEDCSEIWIGESWGRGRQKATKTNRDRTFKLTSRLQRLLLERRPDDFRPDDLVFPSSQNRPIDDHNYRNRHWKPALTKAGVPYRKPYSTRHTFISHALTQGLTLTEISDLTGNTEETLLRNYVGNVRGVVKLPEIWSE